MEHPAFQKPSSPDTTIWRFLTQEKFEWLINEKRLLMPIATKLGHPQEGTQPIGDINWWHSLIQNAQSQEEKETLRHNKTILSQNISIFKEMSYVSCWHINENINFEMWKEYANTSNSVAISSTARALKECLPHEAQLGVVRYINYTEEKIPSFNIMEYITHKPIELIKEQEIRAVVLQPPQNTNADSFYNNFFQKIDDPSFKAYAPSIDIKKLIKKIVIHPKASDTYCDSIKEFCLANSIIFEEAITC